MITDHHRSPRRLLCHFWVTVVGWSLRGVYCDLFLMEKPILDAVVFSL